MTATDPKPDLLRRREQTEAYLNLTRIHRDIERRIGELLHKAGLRSVTPAQANVMLVLFEAKAPLSARLIAQQMALSEVTVGRFIKALERAAWVERETDRSDGRRILVRPTAKAYRALPRFIEVSNMLLDEVFCGMSPDEIAAIRRATQQLRSNIGSRATT